MSRSALAPVEDFGHVSLLPVRWGDMDSLGHVNNAVYFTFDEQARLEYFDAVKAILPGFWVEEGLILARIGCDFLSQVHYPATVKVHYRVTRLGRSSMQTEAQMRVGDQTVARTEATVVWFDYTAQKAKPIPDAVRAFLAGREPVAPAES